MAGNTDHGTHHQHKGGGCHGNLRRESEDKDHHRYVHDAPANTQNRRDKAHKEGKRDADSVGKLGMRDVKVFHAGRGAPAAAF